MRREIGLLRTKVRRVRAWVKVLDGSETAKNWKEMA
jgi:hypothetical protein